MIRRLARSIAAQQFVAYLVVGGLSSLVDVGGFVLISRALGRPLLASALSFTAATLANYFLSYMIAFVRARFSRAGEIWRIAAISVAGLGVNTLAMWAGLLLGAPPLLAKIVAVPIVLVWNFLGRRLFVFQTDLPPPALALAAKARRRAP